MAAGAAVAGAAFIAPVQSAAGNLPFEPSTVAFSIARLDSASPTQKTFQFQTENVRVGSEF